MPDDLVLYDVGGDGVALITLNRSDRMNGLSPDMEDRYFDLLLEAGGDPNVRAIVVTGSGRAFCAGADVALLEDAVETGTMELGSASRRPITLPLGIAKPVVGAINGAAAGAGLALALMFDVRFAASGAKLTFSFPRRGLIAEYCTSWLLPRLIGTSRALDLLLSARVVLAEEALELGLVNRVAPAEGVLDAARAYAADLASGCSPASMAVIKQQVYADWEAGLEAARQRATSLMAVAFRGPDFVEGVQSYLERRPPAFPDLGGGSNSTFVD
ncbi:MAG TPA: enoyl-CoA hydratase-related protein [Acidimicrobiales bacterium]|nr:enoyl-CoA hydratase-related protein [Acidimicrobiales bacterium]